MKGLKTNGRQEIAAFRRRVIRQHAAGRISDLDFNMLMKPIKEINTVLDTLEEVPEGSSMTLPEWRRNALRDEF